MSESLLIGLVAGETSGDVIGAGLINSLRNYIPQAHYVGIAGPRMQAEGMEAWYDMEELSVMGLVEIIKHIPRILRIRYDLVDRFVTSKIKIFIGIDAPDFTITLEDRLKKHGIYTIHYVSPAIWAWRPKRIEKIKHAVDKVLTILPFEKKFYDNLNIPCKFVGHMLADSIPLKPNQIAARRYLGISCKKYCLAILPGSRYTEIVMLSNIFLRAAEYIYKYFSDISIVAPLVNHDMCIIFEQIKKKVTPMLPIHIINNQAHQAMIASDVAIVASGTATLECMLAKCPMVVGYRVKMLTYLVAKKLLKSPWVSLPNLLAGRELVTELLQKACKPNALASAAIPLFYKDKRYFKLISTFYRLHKQIRCNANEQAAHEVLTIINKTYDNL